MEVDEERNRRRTVENPPTWHWNGLILGVFQMQDNSKRCWLNGRVFSSCQASKLKYLLLENHPSQSAAATEKEGKDKERREGFP